MDLVIRSVNNLRVARHRCGLKLPTSLNTAMADTTIMCIVMESIKCLEKGSRQRQKLRLTTGSRLDFETDRMYID